MRRADKMEEAKANLLRIDAKRKTSFRWAFALLVLLTSQPGLKADTVRTRDGQVYRGRARLVEGGVRIAITNDQPFTVTLTNLQSAVFAEADDVIAGEHNLHSPWASQDIGSVGLAGGARQDSDSFTLRGSGIGIGQTIDGFHFVYQQIAGDAEIVARVANLESSSPLAQAGLMIRQTLGPESAHAAVLLSQRDPAAFHYRVSRKKPNPELRGPKAPPPRWLKLEKKERFFLGSISEDGQNWKVVGSQTIALSPTRNREDQWYLGLAASSHANGTFCAALFDHVQVRSSGWRVDFFSDDFKTLLKTEVLARLERAWENGQPATALRCTAELVPPRSGRYSFLVDPKEWATLWIDGRLLFDSGQNSGVIELRKDKPHSVKLESKVANSRKPGLKLYWIGQSNAKEILPSTCLRPFGPSEKTNHTQLAGHDINVGRSQSAVAGAILKNGTVLAGVIRSLDETMLKVDIARMRQQSVSTLNVARVQFRAMSPQMAARILPALPGVLLVNGDFIEGEFRSFNKGRVSISSVIFGLRSYDTATEAAALVLRPFQPSASFVVRTHAGSAIFADNIALQEDEISIAEPLLGQFRVKANDLLDIRSLASQ